MGNAIIDWNADEPDSAASISISLRTVAPDLDLLRWYLEVFPRRRESAARNRAKRIERLFPVFAERLAANARKSEPGADLRIVSRRSEVHRLPWELLESSAEFPSISTIIRGLSDTPVIRAETASEMRILLVVSRPGGPRDVPYLPVARAVASLRTLGVEVTLLLRADLPALAAALAEAAAKQRPFTVVQFDVHGATPTDGRFGILLEQMDGGRKWVAATEIAALLQGSGVQLVVANACRSGRTMEELAIDASFPGVLLGAGIPAVIAMAYDLRADAAPIFTTGLYRRLAQGEPLTKAVKAARQALRAVPRRRTRTGFIDLADWWSPVAYVEKDVVFTAANTIATATKPAGSSVDENKRSAASATRAVETAAYHVLASLLRGRHVILGGFGLGGQSLAAQQAVDVYRVIGPARHLEIAAAAALREPIDPTHALRKRVAEAASNDLLVIHLSKLLSPNTVQDAIDALGAGSPAQLLIVLDDCAPASPHFDCFVVGNLDADDVLDASVTMGIGLQEVIDGLFVRQPALDLTRLLTSPLLLDAFGQAMTSAGQQEAEQMIAAGLAGRSESGDLAAMIQAIAARFDRDDPLTILAGLLPLSISESLFRHCAAQVHPRRSVDEWMIMMIRNGLLMRRNDRCDFHPLFAPALRANGGDAGLRDHVAARFIVAMAEYFTDHGAALDDRRAPVAMAAIVADVDAIECALALAVSAEILTERRWDALAAPFFRILANARERSGEVQALGRFAARCVQIRQDMKRSESAEESYFWMLLARDADPELIEVGGRLPGKWHYLLGIEIIVRQLVRRREFTSAEARVRQGIDVLAHESAMITHRLYELIAYIGEHRGWPVMAQGGRNAAAATFESEEQSAPIAVDARRIVGEVRRSYFAYLAGPYALFNVASIAELPARLDQAELTFRTLKSGADLCDLQILSAQIYSRLRKPAAAIVRGEEALAIAERREDILRRTSALLALGEAHLDASAVDTAGLYFAEASHLAMVLGDKRLQALSFAGLAETSFQLGRTRFSPIGFSAYQEMENAYRKLAEWGATEAPQAAVRASIDLTGPMLVGGTTTMTAFQELSIPTPAMLRLTEITVRFVEADNTGETLWLLEAFIDHLKAFEPTQQAIRLLRTLHDQLMARGKLAPQLMARILGAIGKLEPNSFTLLLRLLNAVAGTVSRMGDSDLRAAMIALLQTHTDETSKHEAAFRDQSPAEWNLARYHLAGLLLANDRPGDALSVTESLIDLDVLKADPNAGNFFNLYANLLWMHRGDKTAAIAAWNRARAIKIEAGQNTESVDTNLEMALSNEPFSKHLKGGPASEMADVSRIAADIDAAATPTQLLTVHNSWHGVRRPDVHRSLADAFLNRLERCPNGADELLLKLALRAAATLTDLDDPEGAEHRLTRCLSLMPASPADPTLLQQLFNDRGYARLMKKALEGARADADRALELAMAPDFPAEDRLEALSYAWGNRNNAAATPRDQLAVAVGVVAAVERFELWAEAHDIRRFVGQIIRNHPRYVFEDLWRERFKTELPASVRKRLGEFL